MRVLNDEKPEKKESERPVEMFGVILGVLYGALGIQTFFLAPLPMIVGHFKLPEPWPKIVAVLSAVVAIALLGVPMMLVVVAFIFGLVVADGVIKKQNLWKLMSQSVGISTLVGAVLLFVAAQNQQMSVFPFWRQMVEHFFSSLQQPAGTDIASQWEVMKSMVIFQGPFLYVAALILSMWFSIGVAAHMGWFPKGHPFDAAQLRKIRVHWMASVFFGFIYLATVLTSGSSANHLWSGLFQIAKSILFIPGCILLSEVLSRRRVRTYLRTLCYCVGATFGFYAIVGIGVISPWFYRRTAKQSLSPMA